MNPDLMLEKLAPLRTPEPIIWWPPAVGWWIIFFLASLVFTLALIWGLRWHRGRRYRRIAIAKLRTLQLKESTPAEINELLKAVALKAYPAEEVARLNGRDWLSFLSRTCSQLPVHSLDPLLGIYRPDHSRAAPALFKATDWWIRKHEIKNV